MYKYYVCKTINEMMYLVKNNQRVKKVVDDLKNPRYKIFLFDDNDNLRDILTRYNK